MLAAGKARRRDISNGGAAAWGAMWRPGDRAPFAKGKSEKKRSKPRGRTDVAPPAREPEPAGFIAAPTATYAAASTTLHERSGGAAARPAASTSSRSRESSSSGAEQLPAQAASSGAGGNKGLSVNLRNMAFMARKEEARKLKGEEAEKARRQREERWVIDAALIAPAAAGAVVVERLETAPRHAAAALAGRRSFGRFNAGLEAAQDAARAEQQSQAAGERLTRDAIDADEMADRLAKKRKPGSGVSGHTAKKGRH